MGRHSKRQRDAILRNGRPTKQERLKVPSTTLPPTPKERERISGHMMIERKLLAQRRILKEDARKKFDELDEIFQQIAEINAKIEEQRQKQLEPEELNPFKEEEEE